MTLRVEISIIPFGRERERRTIETFNISNISFEEKLEEQELGDDTYVIEHHDYKNYGEDNLRVSHKREDGAIALVVKALQSFMDKEK